VHLTGKNDRNFEKKDNLTPIKAETYGKETLWKV